MPKKFEFEGTTKSTALDGKVVAIWTDGIGLSSDNDEFCAYKLQEGKKYKVTVEEIK